MNDKAASEPQEAPQTARPLLIDELGLLIEGFDKAAKIDIQFGYELTLDVINKKRDELAYAIKRLKLADNMLSRIHSEYTLKLERYGA